MNSDEFIERIASEVNFELTPEFRTLLSSLFNEPSKDQKYEIWVEALANLDLKNCMIESRHSETFRGLIRIIFWDRC